MRNYNIACLALSAVLLSNACYQPVANTTDEFKNDRADDRGRDEPPPLEAKNSNDNSPVEDIAGSDTENMSKRKKNEPKKAEGFRGNLNQHIGRHGLKIADIVDEHNSVERRLLEEYGAVFLTKAVPPSKVMFTSEGEVSGFQNKAGFSQLTIDGISLELQPDASRALESAQKEAKSTGLNITPRDPEDSARRSYEHTFKLWNGRFTKACRHWLSKGRLTSGQINDLKSMPIKQQVSEVLRLEQNGIYFSTNFDKSILYSVAAPGTSQHLSMLAFDAREFGNKKVRKILANHGWFRTVQSDAPHFTYLGYSEKELPSLGLKMVTTPDGEFWIPNV